MADIGILSAGNVALSSEQIAPREILGLASSPSGVQLKRININIPGLLKSSVKALMIELSYLETGNDATYNQDDRYGKYAVHKNTLINYGYLNADGTTWEGLEGIEETDDFLLSPRLQDRIMERFLMEQYTAGIKAGSIKENDSASTVAGMLAVAYQFQDYTYSSSSYDSSYLVSTAANLSLNLSNTLSYLGYANVARSHYDNSDLSNIAVNFRQTISVGLLTSQVEKRLFALVEDINESSIKTTQLIETALFANIQGRNKQLAIANAQSSISSLDNKIASTYQNIPANRAKEWRLNGNIKDSRGRFGSLFYKAGKYAIDVLNAGITT